MRKSKSSAKRGPGWQNHASPERSTEAVAAGRWDDGKTCSAVQGSSKSTVSTPRLASHCLLCLVSCSAVACRGKRPRHGCERYLPLSLQWRLAIVRQDHLKKRQRACAQDRSRSKHGGVRARWRFTWPGPVLPHLAPTCKVTPTSRAQR
jgi:hypothetical protein